jgi:excisionase family DNA binding protein
MHLQSSIMANNDWLTVQDAARLSGYRADHLRELIRNGKLEAQKFGPIWAVNRQSLLTYMNEALKSEDRRHGPKSKSKRKTR